MPPEPQKTKERPGDSQLLCCCSGEKSVDRHRLHRITENNGCPAAPVNICVASFNRSRTRYVLMANAVRFSQIDGAKYMGFDVSRVRATVLHLLAERFVVCDILMDITEKKVLKSCH